MFVHLDLEVSALEERLLTQFNLVHPSSVLMLQRYLGMEWNTIAQCTFV